MPTPHSIQNYIDGRFCPPTTGNYIDSLNPATGDIYANVPDSNSSDVDAAVNAALKAFPAWSSTTRQERSRVIMRIADLLEGRLQEFAEAESSDQGKPVHLALQVDIPRFFASYILHMEDKKTELDGVALNYVHKHPVGVESATVSSNLEIGTGDRM
ncbi:Aldehyde dehydrogenase 8 member A1 [Phlyctochytrium bullatum]|nr:Aldehyde dehydrogenase 8 member A1 [Phlyctochytrium bullatum]